MSSHYGGAHFGSSHYLSSHYGRAALAPFTPEPVHPPGIGRGDAASWRWIQQEEEVLIAVIMAFLNIKDDRWH